jgi:hypothetical protein
LAELLMEVSRGNAAARRRLRVDWKGVRALVADLDAQRRAIVEMVAGVDPKEALSRLCCPDVDPCNKAVVAPKAMRLLITAAELRHSRVVP